MKVINLANSKGHIKTKNIGFSWLYFFFGPFYMLFKLRVLSAIGISLLYYFLLPIPGMEVISNFVLETFIPGLNEIIYAILMLFRTSPMMYIGIAICVLIHLAICFTIEKSLVKQWFKENDYLPVTEKDARVLISIGAAKSNISLANDKIYNKDNNSDIKNKIIDVPYILNDKSQSEVNRLKELEKNKKINDLTELYKLGLMTREEYEIQRATIVKNYK